MRDGRSPSIRKGAARILRLALEQSGALHEALRLRACHCAWPESGDAHGIAPMCWRAARRWRRSRATIGIDARHRSHFQTGAIGRPVLPIWGAVMCRRSPHDRALAMSPQHSMCWPLAGCAQRA